MGPFNFLQGVLTIAHIAFPEEGAVSEDDDDGKPQTEHGCVDLRLVSATEPWGHGSLRASSGASRLGEHSVDSKQFGRWMFDD